ncbi:MAG TPA: M28 family metallopeptidase [Phycisphaerales bacterium]|nr:M28 family metallopeptidase [Phycisphaerales bacterium]
MSRRTVTAASAVLLASSFSAFAADAPAVETKPTLPAEAMKAVSPERIKADIDKLVSFRTRHTLSPINNPVRGIGAAQKWLLNQFNEANRANPPKFGMIKAWTESWSEAPQELLPEGANLTSVLGGLRGVAPLAQDNFVYVVAHYDSRNDNPFDFEGDAPGANNNASGVAATLEIARALANKQLDATVVFFLSSGEEQGLLGAKYWVQQVMAQDQHIIAVINLDTIGAPGPAGRNAVSVYSPGLDKSGSSSQREIRAKLKAENDSPSRQLARYFVEIAALEQTAVQPKLVVQADANLPTGDYTAFLEGGYPSVHLSEATPDAADAVDPAYIADVARLNAAVIVHLCNAPSAPKNVRIAPAATGEATDLQWVENIERDVAGYEVVWREAAASAWQHSKNVGLVTSATLDVKRDDAHFGVRAYDKYGYKSPVAFPVGAKE